MDIKKVYEYAISPALTVIYSSKDYTKSLKILNGALRCGLLPIGKVVKQKDELDEAARKMDIKTQELDYGSNPLTKYAYEIRSIIEHQRMSSEELYEIVLNSHKEEMEDIDLEEFRKFIKSAYLNISRENERVIISKGNKLDRYKSIITNMLLEGNSYYEILKYLRNFTPELASLGNGQLYDYIDKICKKKNVKVKPRKSRNNYDYLKEEMRQILQKTRTYKEIAKILRSRHEELADLPRNNIIGIIKNRAKSLGLLDMIIVDAAQASKANLQFKALDEDIIAFLQTGLHTKREIIAFLQTRHSKIADTQGLRIYIEKVANKNGLGKNLVSFLSDTYKQDVLELLSCPRTIPEIIRKIRQKREVGIADITFRKYIVKLAAEEGLSKKITYRTINKEG